MQLFEILSFTFALVLICTAQGNYDNTHNTTEEPPVVYYATDPRVKALQNKGYAASTPSATPEVSPSLLPQQTDDKMEELPDVIAVRIKRRLKQQSSKETQNNAEEKIKFFYGNILRMSNSFKSSQSAPNCSQQVLIYSPNVTILPRRLGSCYNSKDWAKESTVIPGILNYKTKTRFRLEYVTLNCSRINVSGYNFLWNASLKVSAAASTTDHDQPPVTLIIFMLRCENSSGSIFRKDVAYHVEKVEPSKNSLHITQKPATAGTAVTFTDMPRNSTLTTPPPPPSMPAGNEEDDHKNTLGMAIGIPIGIAAVLGLVFGICYHRRKRIMHGKGKRTVLFFRKNNNIV